MSGEDSVTQWIVKVKQGDELAQQALWDRYFPSLVEVAKRKLAGQRLHCADEQDVALSALNSFFDAAVKKPFPELMDRESLWRLLSEMTRRKAIDLIRHDNRAKRVEKGESALGRSDASGDALALDQAVVDRLTPDLAVMLAENCQRLLGALDARLQEIAVKKLEQYTNAEIAQQLGWSVPTIERRLKIIRKIWRQFLEER